MKLNRKILEVRGEDRVRFLNDLLSIEVNALMPLRYGALLSPQGKILTDVFIHSKDDVLVLDLPESEFEALKAKFNMYKLRTKVDFLETQSGVFQIQGEGDPRGLVGARVYSEDDGWQESDYRKARIEACVPEFGVDFETQEAYPREWRFDEMSGIDYRKGCFVGQEVAARMRHKAELLKSVLRVYAEDDLEIGATVQSNDKPVGKILSTYKNEALAFFRLKNLDVDSLEVNGSRLTFDKSR